MITIDINFAGVDYPLTLSKETILTTLLRAPKDIRQEFITNVLTTFSEEDKVLIQRKVLIELLLEKNDRTRIIKKEKGNRKRQRKVTTIKRQTRNFIGAIKNNMERILSRGSKEISSIFRKGLRRITKYH